MESHLMTPGRSHEVPRGSRLETTDPEEAVDLLSKVYCPHRMLLGRQAPAFRMRHEERGAHRISMMRLRYGRQDVSVEPVSFGNFILVMRPLSGQFAASRKGAEDTRTRQYPLAFDSQSSYRMHWQTECRVENVLMDRSEFERAVADLHGIPPPRSFLFSLAPPRPGPAAGRWTGVSALLWRELGREEPPPPLVLGPLIRLAAAAMLENFATTFTPDSERIHGPGSQASVRRAVAFIESHAADDIGLAQIGRAASLSARGVQYAFQRHLGTTPLAYLRRVRLDHAHRELLASSPATATVGRIAAQWGFSNPGRFAAAHRQEYGSDPRAVLHS
jgi:AraC-like DNA-binding protein